MTPAGAVQVVRVARRMPWLRVLGGLVLVLWLFWRYFVAPVLDGLDRLTPWDGALPGSCSSAPREAPARGFAGLAHDAGRAVRSLAEGPPGPTQVVSWLRTTGEEIQVTWAAFDAGAGGAQLLPTAPLPVTPPAQQVIATAAAGCAPAERELDVFMAALSGQESGGSYTAVNARTGAAGRFQILPSNWPAWAAEAGMPGAAATPQTQDAVARFKLGQYRQQFGSWEAVAVAWYAGPAAVAGYLADPTSARYTRPPAPGEPSVAQYVTSVVGRMDDAVPAADGTSQLDIVAFGRRLEAMGARVAEHPEFGGVAPVHKGRGHYEGRAIDVNTRPGVSELEQQELAELADLARREGFRVLFMVEGHYGHMHVEVPAAAGRAT